MRRIRHLLLDAPKFIRECVLASIKFNESPVASVIRGRLYRTACRTDAGVVITDWRNFRAGHGSCLYRCCYIQNPEGKFVIGKNSHLAAFCYVNVCRGSVTIGDDVAIGPGTKIIAYSNHYAKGTKVTNKWKVGDVVIGSNVFIGANCTVLPGAHIQDNVVIGAGSVVKGTLESNTIYAGSPCRAIKTGWFE